VYRKQEKDVVPGPWPLAFLLAAFLSAPLLASSGEMPRDDSERVPTRVQDFSLKSQFGKEYSLHDFADRDLVVIAFVGTECPMSKVYAPRLARLAKKWDAKRVAFVGIDSNQQDSVQEIAAYAARHKIEFPILKDPGNVIADRIQAARTTEVFVLDRDRVVRYQGRIDDQYGFRDGVGYQRSKPVRNDLAQAIDELLAGSKVTVPTTTVVGCAIGRSHAANNESEVTYSNQVSRILQQHCIECHRPGRIGPFVMTGYKDVLGWGEMIREVVDQGRMPPWHANPAYGHFKNENRLTDGEKKLITTWVENGCPEGDPGQVPPPRTFVDGWTMGKPDQVVYMRDKPVEVPAEGVIDYYHFTVDPGWTEDKWIMATEAKPDSMETVHHILVTVQPPGESRSGAGRLNGGNLIAVYAPGQNPLISSSDGATAIHVKAGSKLVFQMHYTPNGTPQRDRSYVGFRFADAAKVTREARSAAVVNQSFAIPAGAGNYEASAERTFEHDALITNLMPHMHTRGKSFRYEATFPNGKHEVLLDVPAYDFNWQTTYYLAEPKLFPKGTKLVCTAHWDNSADNLSNPDPTKVVTWGEQTWEEMMIGFYIEEFPKGRVPALPARTASSGGLDPLKLFAALDANHDGKLTENEAPARLKQRFKQADRDGDGVVTKEELSAMMKPNSGVRREKKDQ
jgi:peroxiredoxin/mono/diheme cytochrome c family protein